MDWVKIVCNIVDHRKIKMIRKGPEGNTLVLLWMLILTEAGKCNRGGYLMLSNSLPYTAETLSMVLDIPLPTVQLGLLTFTGLDMIDRDDGAIFVRNWGRYQSEDKLEARRVNDRERQQRHRKNERAKLLAISCEQVSRDSHVSMSRDVTIQNRTEEDRGEKTTTKGVRRLLSDTPLSKITDRELHGLAKRHGFERLEQAADVAAETWRRDKEDRHNPGGYLQSLCSYLVIPEWYTPLPERMAKAEEMQRRKNNDEVEKAILKAQEEEQSTARNTVWDLLSKEEREEYCSAVRESLPAGLAPEVAVIAMAKLRAWESAQSGDPVGAG